MTEDDARAVLLLQTVEAQAPGALWTAEDRQWATRAAAQDLAADAPRAARMVARARLAMQRLAPRDAALARLLGSRLWRPAWLPVAALQTASAVSLANSLAMAASFRQGRPASPAARRNQRLRAAPGR